MRTLKQIQGSKKVNHYPWYREYTIGEKMGMAINRLRFKSRIWNKDGFPNYDDIYQMVCAVRELSGLDYMDRELFDEGIQYCRIFAYNYKYALSEFKALCWCDW